MRSPLNIFVLVAVVSVVSSATSGSKTVDPSCSQWHGIADTINAMNFEHMLGDGTSMTCRRHAKDCEQMDCSGHFNGLKWNFDFCWGVQLNPCNKPLSMDVHLLIPSKNVSFIRRVYKDGKFPVPGMNYKSAMGEMALYLTFNFDKFTNANKTEYVTISITASLKITVFMEEVWPDKYKQNIIPPTNFTVRHCAKVENKTLATNVQCQQTGASNASTPAMPTTSHAPVRINSNTYNKTCTLTLTSHCGANEMCRKETNKTTGVCTCALDYILCKESGYCQKDDDCLNHKIPTTLPSVIGKMSQTTAAPLTVKKSSISHTALIVGAVLGGVVLVVILGVVIVFCKKRGNSRYHGRQLLLTEDDTDGII